MAYNIDPAEIKKLVSIYEELIEKYKGDASAFSDVAETLKSQGQTNNAKTAEETAQAYLDRAAEAESSRDKAINLEKVAAREELL